MAKRQPYQPIILKHDEVYLQACFSPDGTFLVAASDNTSSPREPALAIVWNTGEWTERTRFQGGYSVGVAVHPAGHRIAFADTIWDAVTGQAVQKIKTGSLMDFSPDGKMLVGITRGEQTGLLLDSETGEVLHRLTKPRDNRVIVALRFVQDGARVVGDSYYYDCTDRLYFWDTESGKRLEIFKRVTNVGERFEIDLDVSPSGRYVITTSGEVQLWEQEENDRQQWHRRYMCQGHTWGVWEASFSKDEHLLATMGAEALPHEGDARLAFSVRLWDVASGQELAVCDRAGRVLSYGISPDGCLLATISVEIEDYFTLEADTYILTLWDIPSGQIRFQQTIKPEKPIGSFRFHPMTFSVDGRWFAITHRGCVEVWDLHAILPRN